MTLQEIKGGFNHFIQSLTGKGRRDQSAYMKYILMSVGGVFLIGIVFVSYRWYRVSREQTAQKIFAEKLADLTEAMKGTKEDLEQAETSVLLSYGQHENSNLAPYFLGLQAEAAVQQGNMEKATEILDTMITQMPTDSLLVDLFKIKKALINLDNVNEVQINQGLDALKELSESENNQYRDVALFYLGRYYWAHDDLDAAKESWKKLIDLDKNYRSTLPENYQPSPWVQQAEKYLQEIN